MTDKPALATSPCPSAAALSCPPAQPAQAELGTWEERQEAARRAQRSTRTAGWEASGAARLLQAGGHRAQEGPASVDRFLGPEGGCPGPSSFSPALPKSAAPPRGVEIPQFGLADLAFAQPRPQSSPRIRKKKQKTRRGPTRGGQAHAAWEPLETEPGPPALRPQVISRSFPALCHLSHLWPQRRAGRSWHLPSVTVCPPPPLSSSSCLSLGQKWPQARSLSPLFGSRAALECKAGL